MIASGRADAEPLDPTAGPPWPLSAPELTALMEQADYLSPYPALQAFLKQHPEIARSPTFFLGRPEDFNRGSEPLDAFVGILAGTGLFLGFLTLVTVFGSVAKQVVDLGPGLR